MSGKYVIQYMFSAGSSAAVVPVIHAIGVGWTFTICKSSCQDDQCLLIIVGVVFSIIGGLLVWVVTKWGLDMQRWTEE